MAQGMSTLQKIYFSYHCNRVVVRSSELTRPECEGGFLEEVLDYDKPENNELNFMSFNQLLRRTVMNTEELDSDYMEEDYNVGEA